LFAQSNNPFMRSLGQFASWAQAKTSQTNALASRVDSGDAALALRMLGLTTVYGGVGQMREWAKPTYDDEKGKIDDFISVKGLKKALELSGNWMPWHIDKAVRAMQSWNYGSGVVESSVPAVSFIGEVAERGSGIGRNIGQGDIEGAGSHTMRAIPILKDISGWIGRLGEAAGYDIRFEDTPPDREERDWRLGRAIGGVVEDVPRVPKEPDERIDKLTGRPYNEQAGGAFIDAEDPLRRLGFVGGGVIDNPLRRLGFGAGGKVYNALRRRRAHGGLEEVSADVENSQGSPEEMPEPKQLYGEAAIAEVVRREGEITPAQAYVIGHEGYVFGEYLDSKGVPTSGAGQTGEYRGMSFKDTYDIHRDDAKRLVPELDNLSENQQKALMSLVYRGDLQQSPIFVSLVNEGNFEQAAVELLTHEEYKGLKKTNPASGIIKRLDEAADLIKQK